ncbi:unnamed protein product [Adineta ricciae]|uniref:G-protein coupled receptors family 1 profile domain-containing protein n=1 Tax=Adineta ricciae TaxID=249248 RepID=A0A814KRZ6_ADIRI|nr:unnamed protein product [Adineta ricciae]CAF1055078.1 unnamed protein product [Adineta ricciae]
MPELTVGLVNPVTNGSESLFSTYDYLNDQMEQYNSNINLNTTYSNGNGPQHLAEFLQQLYSKMSDEKPVDRLLSNSNLTDVSSSLSFSTSLLSMDSLLPTSTTKNNSYHFLSIISFWIVLMVNPIVISFGVTGNLLATYILIRCNIAKLPVSFYTIMLNISDTLNLLIPVLIFWLDNCINRTPDKGYFRDRSNFLCKALMCPDQLFAALSAWYMCAISFNRWYSVCRPSSYFFRATISGATSTNTSDTHRTRKKHSTGSMIMSNSSFILFCIPFHCLVQNTKLRQHLQAFRSIFFITLMGILCCVYPIFMHELRAVISTNGHVFDLEKKKARTYAVIWKRCYYSQKHEYAYDIIGIILSCFLHILPLTFVAAMNIMIILRLRKRQRLMTISANLFPTKMLIAKKKKPLVESQKCTSYVPRSPSERKDTSQNTQWMHSQPAILATRKDQGTSTDLSIQTPRPMNQLNIPSTLAPPRRHRSRDRTITIMLVSVALSYLILTLPYRLFWSYNVYIKRMHPEKLTSAVYLLKMHYIDHILRTIRNIHYGTNFVFFIFLSKTFRRKFRQIFIEKLFRMMGRVLNRSSPVANTPEHAGNSKTNRQRRVGAKSKERASKTKPDSLTENGSRSLFDEIPSAEENRIREDEILPILELQQYHISRYNGE